jgi:hypothetical protein
VLDADERDDRPDAREDAAFEVDGVVTDLVTPRAVPEHGVDDPEEEHDTGERDDVGGHERDDSSGDTEDDAENRRAHDGAGDPDESDARVEAVHRWRGREGVRWRTGLMASSPRRGAKKVRSRGSASTTVDTRVRPVGAPCGDGRLDRRRVTQPPTV